IVEVAERLGEHMLPVECSHRLQFPAIDALMGLRRLASSHVPVYRLPQMRNRTSAMADANASRRRPVGGDPGCGPVGIAGAVWFVLVLGRRKGSRQHRRSGAIDSRVWATRSGETQQWR